MTIDRFHDDLDALLKRHDPARRIDPQSVARISRAVLTRIAAEPPPPGGCICCQPDPGAPCRAMLCRWSWAWP